MENLNLVKPEKVQNIINKFCYTIGMIPTSYKMSLTYEEQIIAIGHYLETTVYPAINNNAEALAELQNLFLDLKNYVDNYFNNLDVQDEINIKLDEMAQNGTLAEIINTFIETNCSINFSTVAEMKASSILKNGSYCKTLGYYTENDGGSAFYKIKDTHSQNDEFVELNNGLFAILTPLNNTILLKQFGAIGDNLTNEYDILQRFFNYESKNYIVNNGNFCTLSDINLKFSNCQIKFENATIRFLPNASRKYYIMNCYNLHDILFDNIHLIGDKEEHTGTEGEWGHCLNVTDSYNITIKNSIFENAWGDGIYLGLEFTKTPLNEVKNLTVDNCKILNSSRNGISVCTGKNVTIKNCYIEGTNRTNPKTGIDIEPEHENMSNAYLENLIIDNVILNKNSYGIYVINNTHDIDFNITNCNINNSLSAVSLNNMTSINKSIINFNNININGVYNYGFYIKNIDSKSFVNITNIQIYNCKKTGDVTYDLQSGIFIDCSTSNSNNLKISNVNVESADIKFGSAILIKGNSNTNLKNSRINNIISKFYNYIEEIDNTTTINLEKQIIANNSPLSVGGLNPLCNKLITRICTDNNITRILKSTVPNGLYEFELDDLSVFSFFVDLTEFETIYDNGTIMTNKRYKCISKTGILKVRVINNLVYIVEKIGTWNNVA